MARNYVNLHGHTTFSDGDGFRMPEDHAKVVAALGQPAMAVTEHGNVSSHVKLEMAAQKAGIKGIYGCELYCATDDPRGQLKNHLTVLAADQTGLSNLYRVVSESWENFHYKPTTTGEMMAEYNEGLIVLSGCLGGRLATAILGGKGEAEHAADLRAGARVAAQFKEIFGDRYYLEVQPHPILDKQKAMNQALVRISRRLDIPLVATGDVHYPTPKDQDIYPILHAITRGGRKNTVETQSQGWEYGIVLAHRPAEEVYRQLIATGISAYEADFAMASTLEIADRCNVTLPKLKDLVFPNELPAEVLFRRWVKEGWKYRGLGALTGKERRRYIERANYEMNLMIQKGFTNYFLVISDMVRWAKDNFIPVGPARGSAAASLVCWLLRITEVNPMVFPNLIFERFIDINRHDLPDVDLDFDDDQRWRIRAYLVDKYGADRVGNIGTFTMYRGKNSLDDIARVEGIPSFAVDQVKDGLLERSSGDLRATNTIEDSIALFPKVAKVFETYPKLRTAQRLEGNLKGFSVHAAGLVVANEPLTNSLAVYVRYDAKGKRIGQVLSIDKYDAEHIGALKIDALGLTTMGVISRCLRMVGMTLEQLYAITLDDEKVYEGFRRNEVVGIFQFDGRAMRSVNREVKPDTFAEICDINALARPGPLHSGAAAEYIMAKHGKKRVEKLHPIVTEITAHTQGQIVYQEQILRTVRELGGFTWEEAAHVRKLISKKQGEQAFNRLQSKFLSGCSERGVKEQVAIKVWKQLVTAGAYAFNAAHCLVGSMLVCGVPVNEAEARKGATSTQGAYITLEEIYRRVHDILPEGHYGVGRYASKHSDPCVTCKADHDPSMNYRRGQCKTCARWRRMFLDPSRGYHVMSKDHDGRLRPNRVVDVFYQGVRECIGVELEDGNFLQATPDHKVWTRQGWAELGSLSVGDELCVDDGPPERKYAGHNAIAEGPREGFGKGKNGGYASWQKWRAQAGSKCELCGEAHSRLESSHKDGNRKNNEWSNLQLVCPSCHRKYDQEHNDSRYGGHHIGRGTKWIPITRVVPLGERPVYDLEMEAPNHNFTANDIVVHNCVSYGLLAYWTMWLKQNHPLAFYCAALQKYDPKTKGLDLLKEAAAKGIRILPPSPARSGVTWRREGGGLRAGFVQVPGIGPSMAPVMKAYRKEHPVTTWGGFLPIKGFGPGTQAKLEEFSGKKDPFGVNTMLETLQRVRGWLWQNGEAAGLPMPTSKAEDVPYDPKRGEHIWVGYVRLRNLKDIYELHRSRTGEELDPAKVKEPQYVNYAVITGEDETGPLVITVHRRGGFYEKYKDAIWDLDPVTDLLLVRGYKRNEYRRAIYASELHVLTTKEKS